MTTAQYFLGNVQEVYNLTAWTPQTDGSDIGVAVYDSSKKKYIDFEDLDGYSFDFPNNPNQIELDLPNGVSIPSATVTINGGDFGPLVIYRKTSLNSLPTFQTGSSITASDLNRLKNDLKKKIEELDEDAKKEKISSEESVKLNGVADGATADPLNIAFSQVTGTPNSLAGYGIQDSLATGQQGNKADSALQPGDIGSSVQSFDADTVIDANYQSTANDFTDAHKSKVDDIEEIFTQSEKTAVANISSTINTAIGNTNLDDLSDVDVANPDIGRFLKWNGTEWVASLDNNTTYSNFTSSTAGLVPSGSINTDVLYGSGWGSLPSIPTTLNELTNVSVSNPNNHDYLRYVNGQWVANNTAQTINLDDLLDVSASNPNPGNVLKFTNGIWQAENENNPTQMTAATSSTAGSSGLTPPVPAGSEAYFLRGDSTWAPATLGSDPSPQLIANLDANGHDIDMGSNLITDAKVGQWDTAYSWNTTKVPNWDAAYGWGDHSVQGYLTSETPHTDVVVDGDFSSAGLMKTDGSGTYSVTTDNTNNWDTAYGWGNHASAGYITSAVDASQDDDYPTTSPFRPTDYTYNQNAPTVPIYTDDDTSKIHHTIEFTTIDAGDRRHLKGPWNRAGIAQPGAGDVFEMAVEVTIDGGTPLTNPVLELHPGKKYRIKYDFNAFPYTGGSLDKKLILTRKHAQVSSQNLSWDEDVVVVDWSDLGHIQGSVHYDGDQGDFTIELADKIGRGESSIALLQYARMDVDTVNNINYRLRCGNYINFGNNSFVFSDPEPKLAANLNANNYKITNLAHAGFEQLASSTTVDETFVVKLANRVAWDFNRVGPGNVLSGQSVWINGEEKPVLNLKSGGTYKFDLSDSSLQGKRFVFLSRDALSQGTTTAEQPNVVSDWVEWGITDAYKLSFRGGSYPGTDFQLPTGGWGNSGNHVVITLTHDCPTLLYYTTAPMTYAAGTPTADMIPDDRAGNYIHVASQNILECDPTPQLAGNLDANSKKITNLATPTDAGDAATKAYADSIAGTTYTVVTTSADGLAPQLPNAHGGKFLKADGTWEVPAYIANTDTTYSNFGGDSGSGGSAGLVPAPASGDAAAGKYLDSSGGWTTPPDTNTDTDTTYSDFVGDDGDNTVNNEAAGLVPAPSHGDASAGKYLKADGNWTTPPDTNTTYSLTSALQHGLARQLPATNGTTKYFRGDGNWEVPPDTNTTYSDFVGSNVGGTPAAGTAGLVPAPGQNQGYYFLRGDGNWAGNATTSIPGLMSDADKTKLDSCSANANQGLIGLIDDTNPQLGADLDVQDKKITTSTGTNTDIVIDPKGTGSVNVSTSKIINVTDPTSNQDAATKKYVDDEIAGVPSGGIASVSADTNPSLGGDLDLNSHDITGTGDISTDGHLTLAKTSLGGPHLKIKQNTTLSNGNFIGTLQFWGVTDDNGTDTDVELSKIYNQVTDATHATADASMFFSVRNGGATQHRMGLVGGGYSEFYNANVSLSGVDLKFTGSTTNNSLYTTLTVVNPTQNNTITFPDATGTVVLNSTGVDLTTAQTLENKTLDDYIETVNDGTNNAGQSIGLYGTTLTAASAHIHHIVINNNASMNITIDIDHGQSMLVRTEIPAAGSNVNWIPAAGSLKWVTSDHATASAPVFSSSVSYFIEFWKMGTITFGALVGEFS